MKKRTIALLLSVAMAVGLLAGCGSNGSDSAEPSAASESTEPAAEQGSNEQAQTSGEKDVVTALLPPVSGTYQEKINSYIEAFNSENANIEIQVTTASWEDMTQKLDVQVNAGSPPDIAFIGSDGLSKYLDMGMAVDISNYLPAEKVSDFDEGVLKYFCNGDGIYGFPAYCEVQCIGGNREMLEAAGIDWKAVQKNGWTYDEFREAIKKGVKQDGDKTVYGFLFA